MKSIEPKVNEIYVSKKITLYLPYRKRIKEVTYMIIAISPSLNGGILATLKSIRYPCPIPNFHTIQIKLPDEFPSE